MSSRDDIGTDYGVQTKRAEPKGPILPSQCYGFASSTPTGTFSIRVSALKVSTTSSARAVPLRRTPRRLPFVHVPTRHAVSGIT